MRRLIVLVTVLILSLTACQQESGTAPAVQVEPAAQPAAEMPADPVVESQAEPEIDLAAIIQAAVGNSDRPEADTSRDHQRKPAEVIAFFGVQPGMTVLDFFAGGGYYTELMSRVVGPDGKVLTQNPAMFYENWDDGSFAKRIDPERLSNVVRHDHEMDELALEADSLDAIVAGMVYHDIQWIAADPDGVVLQLCKALKPGGLFLITDHAAPEGTGNESAVDRQGPHRIEEAFVIKQMEDAGFKLLNTSDLLREPSDDLSKPFFAPEMQAKYKEGVYTDRFVLLFTK